MLKPWRGTQRYLPLARTDEEALTEAIIELASEYGRYGYRRIAGQFCKPKAEQVGKDRVQRIWRREGLKVPAETNGARQVVAKRRFVRAAAAGASESCVEL